MYKHHIIFLGICTFITAILISLSKSTQKIERFANELEQKHKDIIHGIKNKSLTADDIRRYIQTNVIQQKDIDITSKYL